MSAGAKSSTLLLAAAATCALASIAAAATAQLSAPGALALAGIASVAVIVLALAALGGFNNILFVFLVFHVMYGLSGPVNALYGEPLSPLFSVPYETAPFLANYAYATLGLACAFVLGVARPAGLSKPLADRPATGVHSAAVLPVALLMAAMASGFELINLARVGPATLLEGKATYQSATDALTLTAPSYECARLAFCLLALGLATRKLHASEGRPQRGFPYGWSFFLLILPLLGLSLVLGRRGPLLDWLSVLFIGSTWFVTRRRISKVVAFGTLATYLTLGMIYANRASLTYALLVDDFSTLGEHVMQPEVLVTALNPGANEFGAAFGNFSEYVKYDVDGPQYGRSYVEGFALIAPSFLYPGEKPVPVAIEFRDKFFTGLGDEGAIAGTAYSSILEAYYNFREPGVVLVYFVFGSILMALERRRRRSGSLVFALVYLSMVPASIVFHRADFGAAVVAPMFYAVVLALFAAFLVVIVDNLRNAGGRPTPSFARTAHAGG